MNRRVLAIIGIALVAILATVGALRITKKNKGENAAGGASTQEASGGSSPSSTSGSSAPSTASSASKGSASPSPSPIPDDYVFGSYLTNGPDDQTPRGCTMQRGTPCKVLLQGRWRLANYDKAIIRLGAYENGSDKPSLSKDLPVTKGMSRFFDSLQYVPSQSAESVLFRIILLSADGKTIFEGLRGFPVPIQKG